MRIANNTLELIGNTPMVKLRVENVKGEIWAKLEGMNPGGSVKDRAALYMIKDAERKGLISKDKIIVESTSGNTGIGLAVVAAIKGYRVLVAMPESVSIERRKILMALGCEIVLTPAEKGTDGAFEYVKKLVEKMPDKFVWLDQYSNEANVRAHYETTAPEIWEQMNGSITHLVAGIGTGGTITGIGRFLKEKNPSIRIIGVEPDENSDIQGLRNLKKRFKPSILDKRIMDEIVYVNEEEALKAARYLARTNGLLVGMSSGAAFHVARRIAQKEICRIAVIFPDMGFKYLSTRMFDMKALLGCAKYLEEA